jgi:uncharacterized protein (TIGR02246 family)
VDAVAIRNLVVRYSLAIDDERIDEVAAMFTPDATFAARYGEPLRGRESIAAFLAENAAGQEASVHTVAGHLIEPDGAGQAVGIVQVLAELDKGGETLHFSLRCHDRYRELEGRWLFAHRGIVVQGGAVRDPETAYVLERLWGSQAVPGAGPYPVND